MNKLLCFSIAMLCTFGAFAQMPSFCGTNDSEESHKFLDDFFAGKYESKNNDDILWVPMTIHLVNPSDGEASYDEKDAGIALCVLNEDFINTNIQFYLSSFNYIYNDAYFDHDFGNGIQMMNLNNIEGTANSYFVSSPAGNCGYFAPSGGAVALAFNCTGPFSHTWAHEMGHYFSLPHTFRGWEGEDYVAGDIAPNSINGVQVEKKENKDNCENQADRFCDTPVDYLSFRWNCNNQNTSGVIQTDPDSIEFRSDGTYYMSYSNDACMDKFSPLQEEAMVANLNNTKPEQIDPSFIETELDIENIFGLFPINEEIVTETDVLLEWEGGDENVLGYYIEVSRFEGFNFIQHIDFVTSTSYLATDLIGQKNYYWRITPYSQNNFCGEPIGTYTFQTNFIVANENEEIKRNISITPNPNNGQFTISSRAPLNGMLRIYNTHSQLVYSENILNSTILKLGINVPAGIYILQIEEQGKKINKKFIVQ